MGRRLIGAPPGCSLPGCDGVHYARTWCQAHYRYFLRTGLHPETQGQTNRPLPRKVPDWVRVVDLLAIDPADAHWKTKAACPGVDTAIFFPSRHASVAYESARAICDSCLVRLDCLAHNLAENHGMFGGTTPVERKSIRRAIQAATAGAAA